MMENVARRQLCPCVQRHHGSAGPFVFLLQSAGIEEQPVAKQFLRVRRANLLVWAVAWWIGCYVLLRFGFAAPIPSSVISLYMGIISIAILAYVSSSQQRREDVSRPLVRLISRRPVVAISRLCSALKAALPKC